MLDELGLLAAEVPENGAPGEWGTAARNSITGPSQFSLNAAMSRTFRMYGALVTAIITERGILREPYEQAIEAIVEKE